MEIVETAIPDVKLLTPRKFGDHRGFFVETYNRKVLEGVGFTKEFVQDNHSLSVPAGTVRGLHFQLEPYAQDKLVRVMRGAVLDVAVDLRQDRPPLASMYWRGWMPKPAANTWSRPASPTVS